MPTGKTEIPSLSSSRLGEEPHHCRKCPITDKCTVTQDRTILCLAELGQDSTHRNPPTTFPHRKSQGNAEAKSTCRFKEPVRRLQWQEKKVYDEK